MRISDWSSDVCSSDLYCLSLCLQAARPLEVDVGSPATSVQRLSVPRPAFDSADSVRILTKQRRSCKPCRQRGCRPQASAVAAAAPERSEEHTSELQSLMRISYAVFCLKKKKKTDE